jgi:hypothetical protein
MCRRNPVRLGRLQRAMIQPSRPIQPNAWIRDTGCASAASPYYRAGTRAYAHKAWSRFPFTPQALDASQPLMETVLTGLRSGAP